MEGLKNSSNYLKNVLTLAYLGDSVFALLIKEYLVKTYVLKPNALNKKANSVLCARAQAEIMRSVKQELNADELDIVMRARNTQLNSRAKHSTLEEYSLATQLEALIGYWYLNDEHDKLENLLKKYVLERLWLLKV